MIWGKSIHHIGVSLGFSLFIVSVLPLAVPRPPNPHPGWRSVTTTDILVWDGKYYLYYQAFSAPS